MTADDGPQRRDTDVDRVEWLDQEPRSGRDRVAREEPLEIRIGGVPIAVVMRTPGNDEDLVRGFLLTERIVSDLAEIASVRHCTTVDVPEAEDNIVQVTPAPGVQIDVAKLRRNLFTTSSCGVCGKASIEQAMAVAEPVDLQVTVTPNVLYGLPAKLQAVQPTFAQTGGLHAAALFTTDGELLAAHEDIGRHNAVDKVVGAALAGQVVAPAPTGRPRSAVDKVVGAALTNLPRTADATVLMVSGRVSFEIVQKALAVRIPIVAAVSAPSSLAVELSNLCGLTLCAFVRGRRMCVYAGADRIHT